MYGLERGGRVLYGNRSQGMRRYRKPKATFSPRAVPREKLAAGLRGLILLTVLLMARSQVGVRTAAFDLVVIIGAAYVLASTFLPWSRFGLRRATLAVLVADVGLITALIHAQSGIGSDYYLLYYLPILQASIRLNLRDAVGTSLLSAASYILVAFVGMRTGPITVEMIARVATFTVSAVLLAGFFFVLSREQREFERLSRAYDRAMRSKDEFLSRVSHEFRTPLTAIVGFSQLLHEHNQTLDTDHQHEYLVIIREQSQQLARMIEDMLDISRIQENRLVLKREPVSLGEAIESALMLLDSAGDRERVRVTIEPRLPIVDADRNELEQVLSRLVLAAITCSAAAAPIDVKVGVAVEDHAVQVTVLGAGMEAANPELSPLVDANANAVERARDNARFLGLGVAKALVELHGGRIWLDDSYVSVASPDEAEGDAPRYQAAICFTLPVYEAKEAGPQVIIANSGRAARRAATDRVGNGSGAGEEGPDGQDHDRRRRPVRAEADARQP